MSNLDIRAIAAVGKQGRIGLNGRQATDTPTEALGELPRKFWQSDCVEAPTSDYRVWLSRDTGSLTADREMLIWGLANPSTAGLDRRDATDRKVAGFSARNGFRRYGIWNPFTRRATDPRDLMCDGYEAAVGPLADQAIAHLLLECANHVWPIVVGWGSLGDAPHFQERLAYLVPFLREMQTIEWLCLGRTKSGQPRHPLMMAYSTPLEPWSWEEFDV